LFVNRPDALTTPGGDTTHMLRLKAGLEAHGHTVEVACTLTPDPEGFDLINVFNLLLPHITLQQVAALRAATLAPIVLTPFYWEVSESLWGERVVSEALSVVESDDELRAALAGIASGELPAGRFTRRGHNRVHVEYETLQRAVLGFVDAVIPVSDRERAALTQRYSNCPLAFVIPTGAEAPAPASPHLFVERFGLRDFVLVTGRVEPRKNQLMLLAALRDTDLPVVVAGAQVHAEYAALCRGYAPPNTLFTGRLDDEMLASARAAARVHALPSWWECAGLASLEAALAGCSVVMGNRAAEPEYFGEGAYYCDPADVESVRAAVLHAHQRHAAEADRREALRASIIARCSWDSITTQTLEAYRAVGKLRQRPGTAPARRELARAWDHGYRGQPQAVIDTLAPRLRQGNASVEALTLAGDVMLANRYANEALAEFNRAVKAQPDNGNLHRRIGCALLALGRRAEAEASLRRAVELSPDDSEARYWLAQLWRGQERWPEAVALLQTLLVEEPNNTSLLTALGDCHITGGHVAQARACYERALRLNSGLAEVAQRLLGIADAEARPNPPGPISAADTFQWLLDSENLPAALESAARDGLLTSELVELVRRNAQATRADGDEELAGGLDTLAAFIADKISVKATA
jgi:glycosyltransferase involved in cell wall biosynthesis/Tfp pilus assembly protein PilF